MRERVGQVVREHSNGTVTVEAVKEKLLATRRDVERGWQTVRAQLVERGGSRLAVLVDNYLRTMHPAKTEKENIVSKTQGESDVPVKIRHSPFR